MMNTQSGIEEDVVLTGQTQISQCLNGVFDAMALRCCVELRIADIISNHNRPTTLSEIATGIDSPSINIDGLERLMKFLVHKKVFNEIPQAEELEGERETLYAMNNCSKWLLSDAHLTLAPIVMSCTDPVMVSPLHVLSRAIKEGGTAFKMTHGEELYSFSLRNPKFNRIFNEDMACAAKINLDAIISSYRNGFLGMKGSVVDVGGGTGVAISEIVKAYPHLKGINFDLQHVISTAPTYDGVTHVAGDMFEAIPPVDTIFMKWILHNWSDDDCAKILTNCRKAIPKETGRVIIVEIVQQPKEDDAFSDTRFILDLSMLAYFSSGKERSEKEWKKLLGDCGFFRYNITKMPSLLSIIEAFP
ncbi:desmethylxanthohumol 6'-O-methyltransferase [Lactuca sativa]|uniref:desmethylxanthohumol 6'-O-methyltransferase n=1 Tax=Lactuca sativa TaxID=4236 RepID=UPI000CBAA5A9|nr:desmethylxanthohumol 6'-O-methyltransferase [Lactuca sativa]